MGWLGAAPHLGSLSNIFAALLISHLQHTSIYHHGKVIATPKTQ